MDPQRALAPRPPRALQVMALATAFLSAGAGISSAQAPLRRGAPVQPVALVERGDLLVGVGAAYEANVRAPLITAAGDLGRYGIMGLAFGLADGIVMEIRGDAYRVFQVRGGSGRPAGPADAAITELDEDLSDGVSTGSGDFLVGIAFNALGRAVGPSLGGRVLFSVPSSDEDQGLGTNSMSIRMSALAGYGADRWRLTGEAGVGILEAPVEHFEQNDVLVYSAELLFAPLPTRPLRLFAAAAGQASTRDRVPLGTEDLGQLNLGADYRLGSWLVDVFGVVGYAGNSPAWGLGGGVAFLVER